MLLHREQHLHQTISEDLQTKGCCIHGSVTNVVFLGRRRPQGASEPTGHKLVVKVGMILGFYPFPNK